MRGEIAPLVDDVENFCADDSTENDQNAEVPSLLAIDAEALGVADTDPQADEDSHGNQEAIGRQEKSPDMN